MLLLLLLSVVVVVVAVVVVVLVLVLVFVFAIWCYWSDKVQSIITIQSSPCLSIAESCVCICVGLTNFVIALKALCERLI